MHATATKAKIIGIIMIGLVTQMTPKIDRILKKDSLSSTIPTGITISATLTSFEKRLSTLPTGLESKNATSVLTTDFSMWEWSRFAWSKKTELMMKEEATELRIKPNTIAMKVSLK